jgi:hypothetical protein
MPGPSAAPAADDDVHTAVLLVTVTAFHRVLDVTDTQRCTAATISLKPGQTVDHGVSIGNDGSIQVSKTVDLCFEMAPDAAGDTLYYPIGLAFRQARGSGDPDGRSAFPNGSFSSTGSGSKLVTTLTLRDHVQAGTSIDYRFLIAIQRASDAAFGIIDPMIVNSSS